MVPYKHKYKIITQLVEYSDTYHKYILVFEEALSFQTLQNNQTSGNISTLYIFGKFSNNLRKSYIISTVVIICVLLPTYSVLTWYYGTYTYEYAWSVSIGYLSGETPAVVVFVMLNMFLVFCFFTFHSLVVGYTHYFTLHTKSEDTNTFIKHIACLVCIAVFNGVVTIAVNIGYVYLNIHYNAVVVGVAQLLVAGYKLVWNDFVVRNLVIYARRFHAGL
jgi:hypothetical protein